MWLHLPKKLRRISWKKDLTRNSLTCGEALRIFGAFFLFNLNEEKIAALTAFFFQILIADFY